MTAEQPNSPLIAHQPNPSRDENIRPTATRRFRIVADNALMIGIVGLTILIIAWQQHWNNAIAWIGPPLIGGIIATFARIMHHRHR